MAGRERGAPEDGSPARPALIRRASAVLALAALALALGALVAELVLRPVLLPAMALALIVAIVAAWVALISRGVRRWVAGGITILTVLGSLAYVGFKTLAGAALVLVLMVLSGAAARIALAQEPGMATAKPEGRPVGRANRGVLFMNPRSGGGKVTRFDLTAQARRLGVEPILLQQGDDLTALVERAVSAGADVVGMAGGDGSQALVADVVRRHDVAFVCVPAGTRNHFARDLGLDRNNVVAALDAFGEAVERRIDLASVSGRVFVNNASLGLYAAIVQSGEYRDAKLGTAVEMLPDLMGTDAPAFDLRFVGPDSRHHDSADVLLVSNNPYAVRVLARPGSRPRLDSALLGIVAIRANRPADFLALARLETRGEVHQYEGLRQWSAPVLRVDSSGPVPIGLDGEALRLEPPLEFCTLPGALRVRLPPAAAGMRPTGVQGVRRTLVALLRIAAGRPPS